VDQDEKLSSTEKQSTFKVVVVEGCITTADTDVILNPVGPSFDFESTWNACYPILTDLLRI